MPVNDSFQFPIAAVTFRTPGEALTSTSQPGIYPFFPLFWPLLLLAAASFNNCATESGICSSVASVLLYLLIPDTTEN